MSGSRAKALRRAFVQKHGRVANRTTVQKGSALGPAFPGNEGGKRAWLDVIKIAPTRIRKIFSLDKGRVESIPEIFVRKIFAVTTVEPSEWRRWKKDWKRSRRNP